MPPDLGWPPPPPAELERVVRELGDLSAQIRSLVLRRRTRGVRILGLVGVFLGFGQPLISGVWFGNPFVLSPWFLGLSFAAGLLGTFNVISPARWVAFQLKRRDRFLAWWRKLPVRSESPPRGISEALAELAWSRVELQELQSNRSAYALLLGVAIAAVAALSAMGAWVLLARAWAPSLLPGTLLAPFFAFGVVGLAAGTVLAFRWLALPPGLESGMRALEGRIAWMQQQFWARF